MYSDKKNVGILTSLLIKHGLRCAVVCPGSRNAPIISNLVEAGIKCYGVTDERSAGFKALGLSLGYEGLIAIVVTSGSALLNLAPALAEASYRHIGMIVISADRPPQSIGQLEGQTIPQHGALQSFSSISVSLPEPHDDASYNYCQRLINECLIKANNSIVHINVPISEPLFYTNAQLPKARKITKVTSLATDLKSSIAAIAERLRVAKRPMIVVGQTFPDHTFSMALNKLSKKIIVLHEALSSTSGGINFDSVLALHHADPRLIPDFILYCGDTLVSRRLKNLINNNPKSETWIISNDGDIHDPFANLTGVIAGDAHAILIQLADVLTDFSQSSGFHHLWDSRLKEISAKIEEFRPLFSQMLAVKCLEAELLRQKMTTHVHYANSSAARLGNIFARHYIYVNRGVNGIEGSLSTAAGHSLTTSEKTFCIVGDLSFFYDSNSLWDNNLKGNLRILLLNNGGGSIFRSVNGLSPATTAWNLITGTHKADAEGICRSYSAEYMRIESDKHMEDGIRWLTTAESPRPMVLEVVTDPHTDNQMLTNYYR